MATYKVRDPQGNIREISGPDGASDEEIIAQAQKLFSAPPAAPANLGSMADQVPGISPQAQPALTNDNPNVIDKFLLDKFSPQLAKSPDIQASVPGRFIQGMADLPVGAMQLGMNAVGMGGTVNPEIQAIKQRTEALRGSNAGMDLANVAGNMTTAVALGAPKAAATVGKRILQGIGLGGAYGAATPVAENAETADGFFSQKAGQMGTGMAIGGVIPAVGGLVGGAYRTGRNLIDPWLPGGDVRAAVRTAETAAGPRREAVAKALQSFRAAVPGERVGSGEAAAKAGSAEFSALQRIAGERMPSEFAEMGRATNQARAAALRSFGGDDASLAAAIRDRGAAGDEAYGAIRKNLISPLSDTDLMKNAIQGRYLSKASALQDQGRFATTAAQQQQLANRFTPVAGLPRISGRYSPNIERVPEAAAAAKEAGAIASARGNEKQFLESTMEILRETVGMGDKSLNSMLSRPSMKAAVEDAMLSAREKGVYFPKSKGEKFTVENLQRIKESLDAGILAAKKSADAGNRPKLSPSELTETRNTFVKWLSEKSPAWRDARLQYAEMSRPINQMQIGQFLENKLVPALNDQGANAAQRGATYAQALRDAPGTIKRSTGSQRYNDIAEILNPQQMGAVRGVGESLGRSASYEQLARQGMPAARDLVGQIMPKAPAVGMFNPNYSVLKSVSNRLAGKAEGKSLDRLAELMQDPKKLGELMNSMPIAERSALIQAIREYARPAIMSGAVTSAASQ